MRVSGKLLRNFPCIIMLLLISSHLPAQDLVLEDGVYAEKPLPRNTDNHAYSRDNISYKINMQLIFDYYFLGPASSEKKKFAYDPESKKQSFNLVDYNNSEGNSICKIMMTVADELSAFGFDTNYTQTVFRYDYLNASNNRLSDELTGVIDNRKNLWMHPPLDDQFAILELNPFPFQNLDENIKSWDWELEVGGIYSDPRWKSWKELITVRHKYQRMKDENLDTKMGTLKCKVVKATGTSEINDELCKTYLKSWYHPDLGFVKLEYTNINGTKLIMELVDVKRHAPEGPGKKPLAEYSQNCCTSYFKETLKLYSDSSFEYSYAEKISSEKHFGKWKTDKDTLLLYDYAYPALISDTLSGNESLISLKDSVEITFAEAGNKHPFRSSFTINGRCFPLSTNDRYAVNPDHLNFISVGNGKYLVKNKNCNKFVVYSNPNSRFLTANRVRNISKCLITDKYILKVNCDGQLNQVYKLDKK